MNEVEIEIKLTKLMQKLQKNSISMEKVGAPYLVIIEENHMEYEDVTKEYSKKSVELQDEITKLALLRAKSLKTGFGNITFKNGGTRRTWNLDELDKVCEENPLVKDLIWKYRDVKSFDPQVLIKVNTKGKSVTEI